MQNAENFSRGRAINFTRDSEKCRDVFDVPVNRVYPNNNIFYYTHRRLFARHLTLVHCTCGTDSDRFDDGKSL